MLMMKTKAIIKLNICFKQCIYLSTLYYLLKLGNAILDPNIYPTSFNAKSYNAVYPLILTPYLQNGLISLAQNVSRVSITDEMGFRSHAGFFTVDARYNSNLYFWYFPPSSSNESAPIILWLQGGPGQSSLYGLFTEIGPLIVNRDGIFPREYHWNLDYHVIFIDNPVGTGFSFTDKGFCYNEECVARGLYNSLQQFFSLFPDLRKNDFIIAGESYAGKYLPCLAMKIYQENDNFNSMINLKGIIMGSAFCDPINQIDYGNYFYELGLLDSKQLNIFIKYQNEIATQITKKNWALARVLMDRLMNGELTNFSYFKAFTGFDYHYNYLQTEGDEDAYIFINWIHEYEVRRSIHVGKVPFKGGKDVVDHLYFDILQSVAPIISKLLDFYPIMFYNGQLDLVVPYPMTENVLRKLKFTGSEKYNKAQRIIWTVDREIAGYWTTAGTLTHVLVRNAGHMVPQEQPEWALDMITRFIRKILSFKYIEIETEGQ